MSDIAVLLIPFLLFGILLAHFISDRNYWRRYSKEWEIEARNCLAFIEKMGRQGPSTSAAAPALTYTCKLCGHVAGDESTTCPTSDKQQHLWAASPTAAPAPTTGTSNRLTSVTANDEIQTRWLVVLNGDDPATSETFGVAWTDSEYQANFDRVVATGNRIWTFNLDHQDDQTAFDEWLRHEELLNAVAASPAEAPARKHHQDCDRKHLVRALPITYRDTG